MVGWDITKWGLTEWFYFVCDFFYAVARCWAICKMAAALGQPKFGKTSTRIMLGVAYLLLGVFNTGNIIATGCMFSSGLIWVSAVAEFLLCVVLYRIPKVRKSDFFFIGYLFWSGLAMLDFFLLSLSCLLFEAAGLAEDILMRITVERGVYLLMFSAGVLCLGYLFSKSLKKNQWGFHFHILVKAAFIFLMAKLVIYFQRVYLELVAPYFVRSWGIFALGSSLLFLIWLVYMVVQHQRWREDMQQMRLSMLESNYHQLQELYQSREILIHDMKNHVITLMGIAKKEHAENTLRYLQPFSENLQKSKAIVRSRHDALDMVLNMKLQEAEKQGIDVNAECDDMTGLKVSDDGICALFANLLDNAIEANQKRKTGLPKWIRICCTRQGNMFFVEISNPLDEKIQMENGIPITTKAKKRLHGFGMRSIQKVVNIYQGSMDICTEGEIFSVAIYMRGFSEK